MAITSETVPRPTVPNSRAEQFNKGLEVISQNFHFQTPEAVFDFVGGLKTVQAKGIDKGKTMRDVLKHVDKTYGPDGKEVLVDALIEHINADAHRGDRGSLRSDYEIGLAMGLLDKKKYAEMRAVLKDIKNKYLQKELTPDQLKRRTILKGAAAVVGAAVVLDKISPAIVSALTETEPVAPVAHAEAVATATAIPTPPEPTAVPTEKPLPTKLPTVPPTPTKLPEPSPTTAPTTSPTSTPEATRPPEKEVNVIDEIMPPFIEEAQKRRVERSKNPEYVHRIDKELNKDRINFMLFGYGTTYERPVAPNVIGSPTIFSYNTQSQTWDIVSVTHDLRAPEVERHEQAPGKSVNAIKLDRAYFLGGMDLMRETLEDATGLSLDFEMALNDVAIKGLVDDIFGGLTVDVPKPVTTDLFYIEDKKYPGSRIKQGNQTMDGVQVLQYMKAMQTSTYNRDLERNERKQFVFEALMKRMFKQEINPETISKGIKFFVDNMVVHKRIESDFAELLTSNTKKLLDLKQEASQKITNSSDDDPVMNVNSNTYIVDYTSGDGGVEWVTGSQNPITKKDLANGVYPDQGMVIPGNNANPYAEDLVQDYWQTTRDLVKTKLS